MSVFSLGGFLKRKKNFHFDFTLRYHCVWVRALPLSPGWSLGLFSSVSRWGCVPKGHRSRFTPPLPTSSRDCTGQGLPLPQHPSGFMEQKACRWRSASGLSCLFQSRDLVSEVAEFSPAVSKCVSFLKSYVALPLKLEAGAQGQV